MSPETVDLQEKCKAIIIANGVHINGWCQETNDALVACGEPSLSVNAHVKFVSSVIAARVEEIDGAFFQHGTVQELADDLRWRVNEIFYGMSQWELVRFYHRLMDDNLIE